MADTSMVELADLIEQRAGIRLSKAYGNGAKRTRKGACPFCGGTDRFAVFVNELPQHYYCGIHGHGCGAHGDAISFLRAYEHLNYFQACEALDIDPGSTYVRSSLTTSEVKNAPGHTWQLQASLLVTLAQQILWSPAGVHALKYLRARGFTDDLLKRFKIGYIPRWEKQPFDVWGLKAEDYPDNEGVWLYEGILIPCYEGDTLWKLTVRRLTGLKDDAPKYLDILGSGEGLFNVDAILADRPVVVCEGPLDALSGALQCSDLAAFVATGSTSRGRILRWEMRFCVASAVLVAYDDDKAGASGAAHWIQTLPNATQWLPWAHDVNEMLTTGKDLRAWVTVGLASVELEATPLVVLDTCATCHVAIDAPDREFFYDEMGVCYCERCSQPAPEPPAPGPALSANAILARYAEAFPTWRVELVSTDYTERATAALAECRFCHVRNFVWSSIDNGWMCFECLSPAMAPVALKAPVERVYVDKR